MNNSHLSRAASLAMLVLVIVLTHGCKTIEPKVAVHGVNEEVSLLAGEWRGEYGSVEANRHGIISFRLEASADSAYGYIIMQPGSRDEGYLGDFDDRFDGASELLTINFVSVGMGRVIGKLDAYKDPGCGCLLDTTFEGYIKEDRIEGDYVTNGEGFHLDTTGKWWVDRISTGAVNEEDL